MTLVGFLFTMPAHLGDKELVKLFLENEKSLAYITDNEGMSALHISAKKGHVGVMREIIEKCPDTCELLDKSRTALHLSVESGLMEPVGFLLGRPEFDNLINERDQEGNTLLHLAATRGYVLTEVLLLCFKKVDKVILNNKDMSTLDILRSATQQNILHWLVEEMPLEPLFHFIRYHIGYLPSLEGVAISEIKEAHDQETGNEPSSEGEGTRVKGKAQTGTKELITKNKVESSTVKIEGNDDEKEKGVALAPNLKAQESVHKEEYSNEILASISLTIATIIATVTFQAACQIPGGYQNNGQPNLSHNSSFRAFLLCGSVSFGLSAFLMCFHFVVAIFPRYFHIPYPRLLIFILSELSLMSMIAAFISIINT
ncbi:ankyrin repeat-containing protein At5g02620-like [Fagus crenata]